MAVMPADIKPGYLNIRKFSMAQICIRTSKTWSLRGGAHDELQGCLRGTATSSSHELLVGGGSVRKEGAALPQKNSGGCGEGRRPPHMLASEGCPSEGCRSENRLGRPNSEGLVQSGFVQVGIPCHPTWEHPYRIKCEVPICTEHHAVVFNWILHATLFKSQDALNFWLHCEQE